MNLANKIDYNRVEHIANVLSKFPNGRGVEVGVFKGHFSKSILESWSGTLYMVDVWRPLNWDEYMDMSNHSSHDDAYFQAMRSVQGHEDRAIMVRATSEVASHMFEDGSLDFVYIDANHAYDYVVQDISLWYPKVKPGGVICGHDYLDIDWQADSHFLENGKDKHIWSDHYVGVFGVNPAVDEFCSENSLDLHVTNDWYGSWFATKPLPSEVPSVAVQEPRVGVLVVYDDFYRPLSDYTVGNNVSDYCDLHGYRLYYRHVDSSVHGRFPTWNKIFECRRILSEGEVDWLFIVDADCLFMDHRVRLESFIEDGISLVIPSHCVPAADFPMPVDEFGNDNIIASAYLVRNDEVGRAMIEDIWNSVGLPEDLDLSQFDYENRQFRTTISRKEYRERVRIVEEKRLNNLWYQNSPFLVNVWPDINKNVWADGDFIVHVTGYAIDQRTDLLKQLNTFSTRNFSRLRREGDKVYFSPNSDMGPVDVSVVCDGLVVAGERFGGLRVGGVYYFSNVPQEGRLVFEVRDGDELICQRIVPDGLAYL